MAVAFSPDGKFAFSAGDDKQVRVWDVASGSCVQILEGHTDGVTSLTVSREGRYIASGSYDGRIKLWEFDWDWLF